MIRSVLFVAFLAIGMASAVAETGPGSSNANPQLTGVWITQVTIRNCATDAVLAGPFPGLSAFHAGGTVSEVGPALPNSTRSPAHGVWQRDGAHSYEANLIFQRYDLAGIYIGTQTIRAELLVDPKSGTYTAKGTFQVQDIAGVQVGAGCSEVVGKRYPQSD